MEERQQKEDSPCGDFSFRLPSPTSDQIPGQVNESSECGTVEAAFVSERTLSGPHTPGPQATHTLFQTPSHQRPDVVDFFTPPLSAGQGRYDSSPKDSLLADRGDRSHDRIPTKAAGPEQGVLERKGRDRFQLNKHTKSGSLPHPGSRSLTPPLPRRLNLFGEDTAMESSPNFPKTNTSTQFEATALLQLERELCQAEKLLSDKYKGQKIPIRDGKIDWRSMKGKLIADLETFSRVSRKLDVFVDNVLSDGTRSLREIIFPGSDGSPPRL